MLDTILQQFHDAPRHAKPVGDLGEDLALAISELASQNASGKSLHHGFAEIK
jgi:hypothetical protein